MRLTADLINSSLSYLNPLKERELDLRGHKIPSIENLGVAKDHDALDLTDNDIPSLSNFPLMPRLKTLLLSRNRISTIQSTLSKSIPNLRMLVMTSNRMQELADLDPLGGFPKLTHVVLTENPVTKKENYRYWILWRCPSIRFLDYQKVKQAERDRANELFGTAQQPTALASQILNIKSRTFDIPTVGSAASRAADASSSAARVKLTDKERKRVERMIRNAKSLAEITKLEKELNEGRVPGGVVGDDENSDTEMNG